MKNVVKIVGIVLVALLVVGGAMAVFDICPPQGPWPLPPWCPGSSIPWPFSDHENLSSVEMSNSSTAEEIVSDANDTGLDAAG